MLEFIIPLVALQFSLGQANHTTDRDTQPADRKEAWQEYSSHLQVFKESTRRAFADEQVRAKTGDCPNERTTVDISTCLKREVEKTASNYRAYSDGLRSIEGLTAPGGSSSNGPGNKYPTSQELVTQFDDAETAWQAYKKAQCSAAYRAYQGGTIAPIMQLTCELTLFRDRMRELESIYDVTEGK